MNRILIWALFSATLFVTCSEHAVAQEETTPSPVESSVPTDTVPCFDYYHFGSVQVDLPASLPQTVPGAVIHFDGELRNANTYPIVDGQVYVKIFKNGKPGAVMNVTNGPAVVDQFALKEVFVLAAEGKKKFSFDWRVPVNAEGGDYTAAFFFNTSKRFNLLGLSFTDDVTGNLVHFTITSAAPGTVAFDKDSVTLNTRPHGFAIFPLHFNSTEAVTATAKLVNPTSEVADVSVTWQLYSWDALRSELLKDTKTEMLRLNPKETRTVSYTAAPTDTTVSYLVATASDGYSKSILNIRFVRDDVSETRINFPSITHFPLLKGVENTLFSCLHSTNVSLIEDNTLTLTLRDTRGAVIHTYEYSGNITSDMMGVKSSFTPEKTYTTFSLTATLKHKGQVVDEVTEVYACSDIDPSLCPKFDLRLYGYVGLGAFAVLLVLAAAWRFFRNRRKSVVAPLLFVLVLGGALLGVAPEMVEAKSVTVSLRPGDGILPWVFFLNEGPGYPPDDFDLRLGGISFANILYNAITSVEDGSLVAPGSSIRVTWPLSSQDISWFGFFGWFGSGGLYGRWGYSAKQCHSIADCGGYLGSGESPSIYLPGVSSSITKYDSYGDMVVAPSFSVSGSGASCGAVQGSIESGSFFADCIVTAPVGSTVNISASWPNAPAHFRIGDFMRNGSFLTAGGSDMTVPTQSIPFTFTSYNSNNPPTVPSITGNASERLGATAPFTLSGTDPDGDTVRYQVDWNADGVTDQYVPATGYVPSGTTQSTSYTMPLSGTSYTVKVRTEDIGSLTSPWVTRTIPLDQIWDGVCGVANGTTLDAVPSAGLCTQGTPSTVTGDTLRGPWSWTCAGIGLGSVGSSCGATHAVPSGVLTTSSPSCTVPLNGSTCTVNLSWNTAHGIGTSAVTRNNPAGTVFSANTGTNQAVTVSRAYAATTYYLYNDAQLLAQTTITPECVSGTSWNGTVCAPPCAAGKRWNGTACVLSVPAVTLSVNKSEINIGQAARLTWVSTDAVSCVAVGGFDTAGASSNVVGVSVTPASTSSYQIKCVNEIGTEGYSNIVTVAVNTPQILSFSASPTRVRQGTKSSLSWTTDHVASCTVSDGKGWVKTGTSGTGVETLAIDSQTTFSITCHDSDGRAYTRTPVVVNLSAKFGEF